MATVMKDLVNWLKQWFYTESEVDTLVGGLQTQINNKAETSTVNSLSNTVDGKADKSGGASQITDSNSSTYTNIGSLSANATQQDINNAINTKIGTLMGQDWIIVVASLPTASASTMGKLYLVAISGSGDNNFKEYVTVEDSGSYSWEKLGEISGGGLSVDWADITSKPSSFNPTSHSSSSTTYGVGTGSNYGHNKVIDNLNQSSNANGYSLSAHQGYVLNSNKAENTDALGVTITLVNKGETNEGCIIFNTIS